MGDYSDLLYAQPSFAEGVARLVDWAGALDSYETSPTPEMADWLALASDWYAVGQDLTDAMRPNIADLNQDRIPE